MSNIKKFILLLVWTFFMKLSFVKKFNTITRIIMSFIFVYTKSRNKLIGGAGIGLTISKAIIEAHSGNITVDSIIGKGTNFVVKVPKTV